MLGCRQRTEVAARSHVRRLDRLRLPPLRPFPGGAGLRHRSAMPDDNAVDWWQPMRRKILSGSAASIELATFGRAGQVRNRLATIAGCPAEHFPGTCHVSYWALSGHRVTRGQGSLLTLSRHQAQVPLSPGRSLTIGAALAFPPGFRRGPRGQGRCGRQADKLRYECPARFVSLLGTAETRFHVQTGMTPH